MKGTSKRIWLDCDPGNDDAMAIILALNHPDCELLGISTVFGNHSINKVTDNALRLITINKKLNIPVIQGSKKPLNKEINISADEYHGELGLIRMFKAEKMPIKCKAIIREDEIQALYDTMKPLGKFHLVMTGCQTNIARLFSKYPDIISQIEQIVFMGGSTEKGNTTPFAEFNIYCDAEAVQIVQKVANKNNINLTMVPLDVTHTVLVTEDIQQKIQNIQSPLSDIFYEQLLAFQEAYKIEGFLNPPLHDPVAVYYVLKPENFVVKEMNVKIITDSKEKYGQTYAIKENFDINDDHMGIATTVNINEFWEAMIASMKKISETCDLSF